MRSTAATTVARSIPDPPGSDPIPVKLAGKTNQLLTYPASSTSITLNPSHQGDHPMTSEIDPETQRALIAEGLVAALTNAALR